MKSLSEIETTVKRASKAAGYSWGVSEETGKSIRLLELFSLPGIKHLNEYFNEKNKSKFENITDFSRSNVSKKYYCPINAGVNFFDQSSVISDFSCLTTTATTFSPRSLSLRPITADSPTPSKSSINDSISLG